jgi:hypothetical protein
MILRLFPSFGLRAVSKLVVNPYAFWIQNDSKWSDLSAGDEWHRPSPEVLSLQVRFLCDDFNFAF